MRWRQRRANLALAHAAHGDRVTGPREPCIAVPRRYAAWSRRRRSEAAGCRADGGALRSLTRRLGAPRAPRARLLRSLPKELARRTGERRFAARSHHGTAHTHAVHAARWRPRLHRAARFVRVATWQRPPTLRRFRSDPVLVDRSPGAAARACLSGGSVIRWVTIPPPVRVPIGRPPGSRSRRRVDHVEGAAEALEDNGL